MDFRHPWTTSISPLAIIRYFAAKECIQIMPLATWVSNNNHIKQVCFFFFLCPSDPSYVNQPSPDKSMARLLPRRRMDLISALILNRTAPPSSLGLSGGFVFYKNMVANFKFCKFQKRMEHHGTK